MDYDIVLRQPMLPALLHYSGLIPFWAPDDLLSTADAGDGSCLVLGPSAAFDIFDHAALIDRLEHRVDSPALTELARQPV